MAEQRAIRFWGTVQGVGFRWTAVRLAQRQGVAGWVRNCEDGSVEMVAEGEAMALDAFLAELRQQLAGYIEHEHSRTYSATGEFTDFSIRY